MEVTKRRIQLGLKDAAAEWSVGAMPWEARREEWTAERVVIRERM